jgi:DNA polymerase III delta prime subunit
MNIHELAIITANIKAQLADKSVAPLFISGSPGTAKSQTVINLAADLNMNILDVSAPSISIEVLNGLPSHYATPEFNQYSIINQEVESTKWSMPEVIANANALAQDKPTILLIDDFHMVSAHLQAYFYKLLLQRMLGNYKLDSNIAIIGTLNDTSKAGFKGISSPIRNRLSILPVQFNFDYWFDNYGRYLDYRVASFLKAKPNYCNEAESVGIEGFASPRAWTSLSKELSYHTPDFILQHASTIAKMQVSVEAAQAFHKHIQFINSIDFESVVSKRSMVDVSKKDLLEQFTYQYISNFIITVEDGDYLLNLLLHNKSLDSFVGFLMGDVAYKYQNQEYLTDGLRFVVDVLVSNTPNPAQYPNTSKAKLDKVSQNTYTDTDAILSMASKYLL